MSSSSLKSQNMKWLVTLMAADSLVIHLLATPEPITVANLAKLSLARVAGEFLIPIVVVLLVHLLPNDVKAMLVFWKRRGVLPGSEAFTKHGPSDPRVNMTALKKNIGSLPSKPAEQNSRWYALYRMVADEAPVSDAHRLFLMYRDMAVLSLLLTAVAPMLLYFIYATPAAQWTAVAILITQYLLTAISARWSGIRFVSTVLAVHSAQKV